SDVVLSPRLSGIVLFARAPVDGDRFEAHRPGELHAQVAEPADAEDRDPVSGQCLRVTQGVVGGDAGAAQRGRFGVRELGRYPGQRTDRRRHRLRVSAGVLVARNLPVQAVNELSLTALVAAIAA